MSNAKIRKKFKIRSPKFREPKAVFRLWNSDFFRHWEFVICHFVPFTPCPPCSSATSASSSAIDLRIKNQEISHTNGKNRTPRRNQVSVKPKTRLAINSGKK